jgi:hypothetical protein
MASRNGINDRKFEYNVTSGEITDLIPISIEAINRLTDTTLATVWQPNTRYVFPTSAATCDIVSTDAQDSAAGTGVRTVLINGLDANYEPLSETITLNGLTPVTTVNSYFRIQEVVAKSAGTGLNAAGTIDLSQGANLLARILPDENITKQGIFTVPAGMSIILEEVYYSGGKNDEFEFTLYAYNSDELIPINITTQFGFQNASPLSFKYLKRFGEKVDIELTAIKTGASGAARIAVHMDFVLDIRTP